VVKTETTSVLIVEDDEHKISDVEELLESLETKFEVVVKKSVREGIIFVAKNDVDLILLDLSLPTFDETATSAGGSGQPQGGLEIVRMLKRKGAYPSIILVSQYHQLEFDGKFVSLDNSVPIIRERYQANVIGAVLYSVSSLEWRTPMISYLRQVI